ncbi:cytochrome P450 [Roseivivax sp. THAF30]|uniref:cytochrome P450 n=1 Tax=Roseivivax sp. THAF30 TaxID=2587852 RepID=UPI001268115F|nr:cytochrome P450 [Roseivivax sp. THAF30]QFT62276.1 Biotin biosynthesis cytochrome P450 [Roseivivax sp. THAF30]
MQHLHQSPTDPAFVQNPYAFYARAREAGPLIFWEEYGMVAATRLNSVSALLKDRRFGREVPSELATPRPEHLRDFYEIEDRSMLELEPPVHTRLRGLVLRAFTSRRIKALGPEIAELAHRLLEDTPDGPFDLLPVFAERLPVIVIARLLGVPEETAPDLLRWSHAMVGMYQAGRSRADEEAANAAARDFAAFLRSVIAERRKRPGNDLLSELIAAEENGEKLDEKELIATSVLLLNAGHEATVHTIGNGVKALLEHGAEASEANATAMSEEILRFDPPLHLFTRYAYEDVTLWGHDFRRGEQVALLLASANRDAELCEAPETFDPARRPSRHQAFGGGLHFCVGAPLARLELEVALPILFARLPRLRLAEQPLYAPKYHFHGLERLIVSQA